MAVPTAPVKPRIKRSLMVRPERLFLGGLFLFASITVLRVGSSFMLPVIIAIMTALLLTPPVRWLTKVGLPSAAAAGVVVLSVVFVTGWLFTFLVNPAGQWISRAPETLPQLETKIHKLMTPLTKLQATAAKVEQVTKAAGSNGSQDAQPRTVQVAPAGLLHNLQGTTIGLIGGLLTVVFLTYFLLATGDRYREKLGELMPVRHQRQVQEALRDMQAQMSTYLLLSTAISVAVGLLTFLASWLIGLPSPLLWGVIAAVLNYIPYIGALITIIILFVAGLISFDTPHQAFLAAGSFFVINLLEGNVITPTILGRKLPLNAVSIFVGLLFWSWIWGVTGAILAVPLMVMVKVACDRIPALQGFGVMLDS